MNEIRLLLSRIKQILKLWADAILDRIRFYFKNFHLLVYRNLAKIISVILLFLVYRFNTSWIENIHFRNQRVGTLLEHLSVHTMFALIIFIFFDKKISELVGLGIGSKEKFYADDFFYRIRLSNNRIRILETYTQEILEKRNREKLIEVIKTFLINAKLKYCKPQIQILLLDPYSDYGTLRIKQLLDKEYEDPQSIEEERMKWLKRLNEWQELKAEFEKFSKHKLGEELNVEIRIYDTTPLYSIYSCDNFAYVGPYIEGIMSTQVEQAIVNLVKPINHEYMKTFNELWSKNSRHTNSPTRELSDYISFPYNIKNMSSVTNFVRLLKLTDENEIEDILINKLNPTKMELDQIIGIIRYLEQSPYNRPSDKEHYNIFGTGGDYKKTINISTMAAILASHYDSSFVVDKLGTVEVSSEVGSETFYNQHFKTLTELQSPIKRYLDFNFANGSKYTYLRSFRITYSDQIRRVRKKIWREKKLPDIFKIVIPIANLTGNSGQVNGVSSKFYFDIYKMVYEKMDKRGIIIFNQREKNDEYGSDEILEGRNRILYFLDQPKDREVILNYAVSKKDIKKYWEYYNEGTLQEHVNRFINFFEQPDFIKETLAYNVAVLLNLKFNEDIDELASKVFDWFKSIGTR